MSKECKLFFSTFVVLLMIQISQHASLSLYEQKKYKSFIEGQGLYSTDDDVEVLTAHNFKSELYGKPNAWIVEFYNSWCGFCQRFAPSWKALGTEIKEWNDLIKVGAVDCSDDDNNPICREFEIISYPTLIYFHENYVEAQGNLGTPVTKGQDVRGHKESLLSTILSEQSNGRAVYFPNLSPSTATNLNQLKGSDQVKYTFLIIYDPSVNTYLGPEVTLDLRKVPEINIKYVLTNNTELLRNIGVNEHNLPALLVIDKDGKLTTLGEKFASKDIIEEMIKTFLQPRDIEVPNAKPKKPIYTGKWMDAEVPDMSEIMQERQRQALMEKVKKMGDVVFQMDLETALRHSLKREVTAVRTVSGEKLDALKAYLEVLEKYFPFGRQGHLFLTDLKNSVVTSDNSEFKTIELRNMILEAEKEDSQVFSSPAQWLGCKGSVPDFRGYPCGVWKMFHYLTVAAAEHNSDKSGNNPREVLDAMYGYIKYFFGCADCSQHFQQMAERKAMKNVSSYDTAVLWLWMAHNDVNKRLAGDQTEDPEYPKYQFPSKERCPACRFANESFNYPEVLNYVKHMYSSINVRYIGSDTRILHMGLEGPSVNSGSDSILRTVDTSMCLLLYFCSFLLIIIVIRMFLKRGYRKKMYAHDLLGKV